MGPIHICWLSSDNIHYNMWRSVYFYKINYESKRGTCHKAVTEKLAKLSKTGHLEKEKKLKVKKLLWLAQKRGKVLKRSSWHKNNETWASCTRTQIIAREYQRKFSFSFSLCLFFSPLVFTENIADYRWLEWVSK